MSSKSINRRTFLDFLGKGIAISTLASSPFLTVGTPYYKELKGISPSQEDKLKLAKGLNFDVLIKWEDAINARDTFGFNNDFTAFLPLDKNNPNDGILWVNHEYVDPFFVSDFIGKGEKTKAQVQKEMYNVGGSILRIQKNEKGKWKVVKDDPLNRRVHGMTIIPFNWDKPIAGKKSAMGTLGNCSGGITPWGTILTCEENYDMFYGERDFKSGKRIEEKAFLGWHRHFDNPPEHYGWVVEVDPKTGKAQKHVALGRCAHECATIKQLDDGRVVVYSGDDTVNQFLYKFVSSEPNSLSKGTLYVANVKLGKWLPLVHEENKILKKLFKDQTEVLVQMRQAAKYIGASPLDRPEDIEIDPINGSVLVSLTNNSTKKNYFGSILKIEETNGDHAALTFKPSTYLAGGEETGFACPDNMAFDNAGNLWITSDISGSLMNQEPYTPFKNNGLFVVPRSGPQAGKVIQIASAPSDAELTGPFFAPDGKTLFLSVQHPGEYSTGPDNLTSHWPDGGNSIPRSSVVAISGKTLDALQGVG
ncbi:MAG: alkaline phosphatase PhoX [Bacteroidota bacterium]